MPGNESPDPFQMSIDQLDPKAAREVALAMGVAGDPVFDGAPDNLAVVTIGPEGDNCPTCQAIRKARAAKEQPPTGA